MEILANYKPSVTFDMHPTGENLNRFVTAGALELSIRNRNIMTLQDIAARGYALYRQTNRLPIKRISCLWRKVSVRITRQKELYRDYPFRQKMDELQNAARSLAQTLLNRDGVRKNYHRVSPPVVVSKKGEAQTAEKPQDKPGLSCGNEKKKVKTKTASVKKQAKPKL